MLDIPTIALGKQLDRHAPGIKTYIWKELCTKEYTSLQELVCDTEKFAMAHRRFGKSAPKFINVRKATRNKSNERAPMDKGNFQLKKLSAAESASAVKKEVVSVAVKEGV